MTPKEALEYEKPVEIYEQVRELVKDPQHGSKMYGALGLMPQQYRHMIHKLCDYAENMDKMITRAFIKNPTLTNKLFRNNGTGARECLDEYYSMLVKAINEHEALKRDVARYFEIYDCELKQGEWWNEYTALQEKLRKVGKKK